MNTSKENEPNQLFRDLDILERNMDLIKNKLQANPEIISAIQGTIEYFYSDEETEDKVDKSTKNRKARRTRPLRGIWSLFLWY